MPEVKLKVMEALQEEAYKGIIRIDSQTMRDLGVKVGDILEIEGGRVTVGIIDRAYPTDVGQEVIRMDGILRRNAKTSIGEVVVVRSTEVKEAKKVTIAPAQPGVVLQIEPVSRIKMGLLGRPIMKGDQVALGGFRRRRRTFEGGPFEDIFSLIESDIGLGFGLAGLKLIVVNTQPKSPVIITENTEITINPHSVEMVEEKVVDVTYEDIGGLDDELKKIREMIEIPLKHPEIFERLGIEPPKGVLLYGAPGTGKTLLAKAVTNETNAHFIHLDSPSVMSKFVGEAEKRIREIFEEAEKNSPSIIFIDEIDAIAPKREESYGEVERRVVAQLLCLDKNTKIYLLNKDIKIKELFDTVEGEIFVDEFGVEYKLPKDEVLVQGVDSEGKLTTTRIISLTKTQILKAYNVKLSNGSEIKTSKITKFLVINNEGVDWVPANEITKGQYVLVPKKINFDSAIHKIDLMSLNEKTKWVAKLPTDGVLNKIFGRNYALLSEINDLIIYKKIKVRTSKKRGDLRDKVLNVLIRNNGSLKQEIQDTLSISRRSLNNALKIISKDIVNISGDFCKLNIKIDENLISEVTELAFKANSKIYPIKEKYFISIPKILDEKLAKFIGLLITDGHLDDRSVNISGETSNIAEKLLNSVIPHKTRLNMVRSLLRLDVDSKALAQFFNDYFGLPIGKKSQIVRVPKQIFESPTSVRCAFLAGLLEGDGTVIDKICISSTSKFLIEDTIKLLLSLEILSYCKKYNTYNAVVHGGHDSISKFNLLIRPYLELERKKLLLNELAITNKKISTINYPVKEMLHNLRADYKVRLHDNMYRYLSPNTSYNINSNIFGYMIQKLGNIENQFVYEMQRLYNSDLIPCMVESVEEMENDEPMYDLTTTTSNFFAGEIPVVVHNTALDGLKSRGKVIVIAATNRPNAIDPALRRPGRFDRELELNIPKEKGRLEILKIHTRNMPLKQDVKIEELARITHGFVGADLEALCKEAAMVVLRRLLPEIGYKKDEPLTPAVLEKLQVGFEDFIDALKGVRPSALREVFVEIPDIKWDDIGGLDDVKQELKEAVEWPLKHPDKFKLMGVKPPKGVLMYGVPGSGKTLLAKAVAHETESNFILVNGPELLSKFVGESEKAVRKVFEKARQASPVVIFFDEIDAIAPRRGRDNGDSGVTERIVNQLLTEIDGLQELNNVVIIGATNRPDIIDPALLRSGRFDRLIQTPVPDEKTRLEIFKIHMKNMPLSKDVKLDKLVESTKNYVGSDIEAVCRESAIFALRKNMESKEITMKEFSEALKKIGPSVREEDIKKYNIVSNKLRNARAAAMKVSEKELDYFG